MELLVVIGDLHIGYKESSWGKGIKEFVTLIDSFNYLSQKLNYKFVLVINGDIFELDHTERKLEVESTEKGAIERTLKIINNYKELMKSLAEFISFNNRVVFIIGNHDLELWYKGVRESIVEQLSSFLPEGLKDRIRSNVTFEPWFYLYKDKTYIEHGHLYDPDFSIINFLSPFHSDSQSKLALPLGSMVTRMVSPYLSSLPRFPTGHASSPIKYYIWTIVTFKWKFFYVYWLYLKLSFKLLFDSCYRWLKVDLEGEIKRLLQERIILLTQESIKRKIEFEKLEALASLHPLNYFYRNPYIMFRRTFLDRGIGIPLLIIIGFLFLITFEGIFKLVSLILLVIISYSFFKLLGNPFQDKPKNGIYNAIPIISKSLNVDEIIMGHIHLREEKRIDGVKYINPGPWVTEEEGFYFVLKIGDREGAIIPFKEWVSYVEKLKYNNLNFTPNKETIPLRE